MGEAVMMRCDGDEGLKDVEVGMEVDVVKKERFSPRMGLRVLLVEADDSTRQVIGALLRKCGYKVSGVSDGLKAWEVLKGMPNSVDLILTEVDLSSISGFALLTLIMEHDNCKNIPVIMMSSNDSVNMVYKCMLRGAADFLVKPVRKNELQNLWQHVWRRQSLKAEGLSDNNQPINLSNGACTAENEECNDKGGDAQSSCSVQILEAESAFTQTNQAKSKLIINRSSSNEEECVGIDSAAPKPSSAVIGSSNESPEAVMRLQQEDPGGEKAAKNCKSTAEVSGHNDALINRSKEAIDLIGNFENHLTRSCDTSSVIIGSTKFDPCPQLDLSLRRRYDDSRSNQDTKADEGNQIVQQSNASAFSRYVAVQQSQNTQANTCVQLKEYESSSDKRTSSPIRPTNLDMSLSYQNAQNILAHQASNELRQDENAFYSTQGRMLPVTVPIKSVRLDRACPSNGSSLHPSYYNYMGASASPTPSPDSAGTKEVLSLVTQARDPNASGCGNHTMIRMNSNGGSGSGCGSNGSGNGNPVAVNKADGVSTEENISRSLQREAALSKFRQKRKDRCFDKKVRYESRKKLAEQRPRVKGQFVRQVTADVSTATTEDTSN